MGGLTIWHYLIVLIVLLGIGALIGLVLFVVKLIKKPK